MEHNSLRCLEIVQSGRVEVQFPSPPQGNKLPPNFQMHKESHEWAPQWVPQSSELVPRSWLPSRSQRTSTVQETNQRKWLWIAFFCSAVTSGAPIQQGRHVNSWAGQLNETFLKLRWDSKEWLPGWREPQNNSIFLKTHITQHGKNSIERLKMFE